MKSNGISTGPSKATATVPSFFIGLVLFSVVAIFMSLFPTGITWTFFIIASFSAAFASSDFIDVVRGSRDVFSPRSLVSPIMVLSVYVAPIMHMSLEAYPRNVVLPPDMVEAFTELAILQLFGHSLYFFVLRIPSKQARVSQLDESLTTESTVYTKTLRQWMVISAMISLALFVYTVMQLGGPQSWLLGQLDRSGRGSVPGAILSLAEAFPLLLFIAYCLYLKSRSLSRTQLRTRLVIAFILLVAITFLTSGLRGSRANLVWPALAALAITHLLFFRIQRKVLATVALVGIVFAGAYDIYKKTGLEGLEHLQEGSLDSLDEYVGYSFGPTQLILGDFSRSVEQAIILDRWNSGLYAPFFGLTYLGDAVEFIPGAERIEALPSKSVAGTEVLYGEGSSLTREKLSTRIYGLQGEALMNFGPLGAVFVFIPYALFMRVIERSYYRAINGNSIRAAIFVPLILPASALLFLSDLDNVLNNLTSVFILPAFAALLAALRSNRRPTRRRSGFSYKGY